MKFICNRDALIHEMQIASDIVSSKNFQIVLSYVLLEVKNNELIIKATDLHTGFTSTLPIESSEEGSCTVYCEKFLGILKNVPEGDISFSLEKNNMKIRPEEKDIDFSLKTIGTENFPELYETAIDTYFSISQKDMIELINNTVHSVSTDKARHFMNGVYIEKDEESFVMVGTDGRRLSLCAKEIIGLPDFKSVIIPPKFFHTLKKIMLGEGGIMVSIQERHIFVKYNNMVVYSTYIDGSFPNYKRAIPENQPYTCIINREQLLEALRRVQLLVDPKSKRLYLDIDSDTITLSSDEGDMGVAKEVIECRYTGHPVKKAINIDYLMSPVRNLQCKQVELSLNDGKHPIVLTSAPKEDYLHVIMPMQIDA